MLFAPLSRSQFAQIPNVPKVTVGAILEHRVRLIFDDEQEKSRLAAIDTLTSWPLGGGRPREFIVVRRD